MCDVYHHKCDHSGCEQRMYLHLANFATKREEIEVYCNDHIPENISDGVLFKVNANADEEFPDCDPGYHGKMFIRALTENAREHWAGNDYNGNCEEIKIFGMNEEEEKAFLEEENRKACIWIEGMKKAQTEGRLMEYLGHKSEESENESAESNNQSA